MFKKFNIWFDNLLEPLRFIYLFGYMLVTIFLLTMPFIPFFLMVVGVVMLVLATVVGISRM